MNALHLAEGMELAHQQNEPLVFIKFKGDFYGSIDSFPQ